MAQTLQYRTAKAIDDAATLIETTGWCRGYYHDGDRHCALGALMHTAVEGDTFDAAYNALTDEVQAEGYHSVPGYNDDQRDRRKVVRLMRRTARKVRRTPQ